MMAGGAARPPRLVNSRDMSRYGRAGRAPAGGWIDGDQQRAWLAYNRVQLRLAYEMNRQLLADSGMSLPDYDVLTGLSVADGGRMQITVLAAQIGWERSRVSHHVRRMSARGLVTCGLSAADRRVTPGALPRPGARARDGGSARPRPAWAAGPRRSCNSSAAWSPGTATRSAPPACTRCMTRRRCAAGSPAPGTPRPRCAIPGGTVEFLDVPGGVMLGAGQGRYPATDCQLPPGSVLARYTDGLIEQSAQDIGTRMSPLAPPPAPRPPKSPHHPPHTALP